MLVELPSWAEYILISLNDRVFKMLVWKSCYVRQCSNPHDVIEKLAAISVGINYYYRHFNQHMSHVSLNVPNSRTLLLLLFHTSCVPQSKLSNFQKKRICCSLKIIDNWHLMDLIVDPVVCSILVRVIVYYDMVSSISAYPSMGSFSHECGFDIVWIPLCSLCEDFSGVSSSRPYLYLFMAYFWHVSSVYGWLVKEQPYAQLCLLLRD